jgi:predicted MFS family arabinose efflux permease
MSESSGETRPLAWSTVGLLASVGGIAVANVYYLQPLLELIAEDFHASQSEVGWVAVGMQSGYALGILAFVPLGDILERRRLLVTMFVAVAAMLACATVAPSVALLSLTTLAIGICTTAPQVLLPFAADLATASQRGRVVGAMQTGLIVGTLYARVAGGFIGAELGWRAVFGIAAVVMALASLVLARVLPLRAPNVALRYRDLLGSVVALVPRYPALRASMALGAMGFATFSAVWTVLAFHLHELGYGSDVVGAIGLLSLLTAVAANWFGVFADRYGTAATGTAGWVILVLTFALYLAGGGSLWGIVAASAIFPLGTQLNQISNQIRIFALADDARSRLNTAYTFTMFSGGAAGALGATLAWRLGGWNGVCVLCFAFIAPMAPILAHLHAELRPAKMRRG